MNSFCSHCFLWTSMKNKHLSQWKQTQRHRHRNLRFGATLVRTESLVIIRSHEGRRTRSSSVQLFLPACVTLARVFRDRAPPKNNGGSRRLFRRFPNSNKWVAEYQVITDLIWRPLPRVNGSFMRSLCSLQLNVEGFRQLLEDSVGRWWIRSGAKMFISVCFSKLKLYGTHNKARFPAS